MARVLLAVIFIMAGLEKIINYAGALQYMGSASLPGFLLPLAIITELGGGLAILAGFMTRWAALALAGFALLSALLFHLNFADPIQSIMFMKNLAIAGGLMALAVAGPGASAVEKY